MREIFVDIDHTICDTPEKDGTPMYEESQPIVAHINFINDLFDEGNTIVYYTSRGAKTGIDWRALTEDQLRNWGCRYHSLRLDKPYYDVIIDDKAMRLPPT
jgi:hypothetical protein